MTASLIHFNNKNISTTQVVMADNRVLEGFIHNIGKLAIPEILGHLQAVGFLHVSCMFGGYKLDLALINSLVERWRPETHTFHFPFSTFHTASEQSHSKTLALQLGLPMDAPVITGLAIVPGKVDFCTSLLGKVQDKFESDVGCQGVIGSVYDDGNAQIGLGVVTVRVEAMNFTVTVRFKELYNRNIRRKGNND
ncbi:hypothetical protein PVK06_019587 [Gossypium arboreum]|uniref:Serine/threonine-protein phosphatase 7 long form homolog n=1 Tax=Gossypium arboreum TaxID=29729 RepID=A0ABR0PKG0_GOSAR|nr:hypothetical protein PVK06_019587 [Gossypium arboreum]